MEHRHRLHIVDADSRGRVELARLAYSLGHHAEVYSGWDELARHRPCEGILVARDVAHGDADVFTALGRVGVWLPVILADERPTTERVVSGIRKGALDFLELPCAKDQFANVIARVSQEAAKRAKEKGWMFTARNRIASLSRRERQVLELLAQGGSNKVIARNMEISPRTVEIHRANMMGKLGAHHPAEAIRLLMDARFDEEESSPPRRV